MRRKTMLFLLIGTAVPLAIASTAWACGVLTTLTLSNAQGPTSVAAPGQTLTATGKNYNTNPTSSPVSIHLTTRTGAVLASTAASPSRTINVPVTIPATTSPGWYVVIATQSNALGVPIAGTPGRTTLRIQGAAMAASRAHRRAAEVSPWSSTKPTGPAGASAGGSGAPALLGLLAAIVMSLSVLLGGLALAGRRGAHRPQLGI